MGEVVNDGTAPIKNGGAKKIVIGVVALVIIIAAIVGIVMLVKPSPEKTVKEFLNAFGNKKASKVIDCYDFIGAAAWAECDGDYEDFVENYKDYKEEMEDDKDEYDEMVETTKEGLEEEFDEVEKLKVEIKDVKNAKEVKKAKNLYTVKAKVKVEYKDDDDKTQRDTTTYNFYVYKASGKYKIVGIEYVEGDSGVLTYMF